jgi:hypothetical protein
MQMDKLYIAMRKKMDTNYNRPPRDEYVLALLHSAFVQGELEEVLLPQPGSLVEWIMKDTTSSTEVWELLQSIFINAREQRLAYLLFHCGLRPREIAHCCSREFSDVDEIHHLRRGIMERLLLYKI